MSHPKPRRPEPKPPPPLIPMLLVGAGVVLLGVIVWIGLGGSARSTAIEVSGAPRLKADRQLVDLGNVKLGTSVEVSFALSNVGDQPLRLTEAPYVEVVEGC